MQLDYSAECLIQLLKQLKIPVTRSSVYEELGKHPDHPSLLAFSDVLTTWGVSNAAYKIAKEELAAVPTPFMAHLSTKGGEFRLIEQVGTAHVASTPLGTRPVTFTTEEFSRAFTGSVLLVEAQPESGEPQYRQRRLQERVESLRLPFIIASCILLVLMLSPPIFWKAIDWHIALLLVAKSMGLVVSGLLLAQSLGQNNPLLQRLCGNGPASGCNTILSSSAARLTAQISWAEVGFCYFVGTWLALLALTGSLSGRLLIMVATLLSLPFTFYSLYYQARVARQWCVLCCMVLAILWIELGAGAPYLNQPFSQLASAEWNTLLGCLLIPVVGWVFIKHYLMRALQADLLQQQLAIFKRNQILFKSALDTQPRYELLPITEAIRLGNIEAQQVVTIITSPTCPPCARAHQILEQWLNKRNDLQVQIVFAVPNNSHDLRNVVAAHLLALHQQSPIMAEEAMHAWYTIERHDYELWSSAYPVMPEALAAIQLQRHHNWCLQAAVSVTPTILLNGQPMPDPYKLEDIWYFI